MGIGPRPRPDDDPVTVAEFERIIGGLMDRVDALRLDQPAAIAEALKTVLTDKDTWSRVLTVASTAASERATTVAGEGFLWLLRQALGKGLLIALVVVLVAKMFGWDAAAKVGKWLSGA